jgi:hypothetical protein
MVQSFIRGLSRWPTVDLAELIHAIQAILAKRAKEAERAVKKRARHKGEKP